MRRLEKELIRINRFVAMSGVCSRRKADLLIKEGKVSVNNKTIYEVGVKVSAEDVVCFNGKQIFPEKKRYFLLNKPSGYITTTNDEKGRKTVMTLIKDACKERIVPVGRLDKETTGLLLFTNDGILAKKMMHPKHKVKKVYDVCLNRNMLDIEIEAIRHGIVLEDGVVHVDKIEYINNSRQNIRIKIHIGKNRIVRRIFEFFNYKVLKLDRVEYASLTKKKLSIGKWRVLTKGELIVLHRNN
ncbi:MAG: pseudouridine synthase [Flavobacteriales bacterium]|mgnify:CR=1 FL=1|nr:pseudouridine synthase [Flavobacteriales bacterium]|tara:strand:+ start:1561 stop:2286 length:726 start_codon:yes stop_codon:yes gene_type:complete